MSFGGMPRIAYAFAGIALGARVGKGSDPTEETRSEST
jgi:hypothetical protein